MMRTAGLSDWAAGLLDPSSTAMARRRTERGRGRGRDRFGLVWRRVDIERVRVRGRVAVYLIDIAGWMLEHGAAGGR